MNRDKEAEFEVNKVLNQYLFIIIIIVTIVIFQDHSQLPLRRTRSGPAPTVRLREVSTLEGHEVND